MAQQPAFGDSDYNHKRRKTRRERFLERLQAVVRGAAAVKHLSKTKDTLSGGLRRTGLRCAHTACLNYAMSELIDSDEDLLKGLIAGDERCFTRLVQRHHGSMLALARGIAGEAIADEVVQEAWLSVYHKAGSFEGRSSLRTWLMRIVANEAKSRLRREKRSVSLEGLVPEGEDPLGGRFRGDGHWSIPPAQWQDDGPDALLTRKEMGECIEKTLDALPAQQKAVFILRDLEQCSFEEICNILEISASNARVLLHRARVVLFGKIEHFQETGRC